MIIVNFTGGARKSFQTNSLKINQNLCTISELIIYLISQKPENTASFDGKNLLIAVNGIDSSALDGNNTQLKSNDVVNIIPIIHGGSKTNIVFIEGEVNSPGSYQFVKGNRFNDYIDFAGGYTQDAAKSASYVVYPNGKSKRLKFARFSPLIYDGSRIVVGKKVDAERFNFTEFVTNYTSIWADITQAWLMINLAIK